MNLEKAKFINRLYEEALNAMYFYIKHITDQDANKKDMWHEAIFANSFEKICGFALSGILEKEELEIFFKNAIVKIYDEFNKKSIFQKGRYENIKKVVELYGWLDES